MDRLHANLRGGECGKERDTIRGGGGIKSPHTHLEDGLSAINVLNFLLNLDVSASWTVQVEYGIQERCALPGTNTASRKDARNVSPPALALHPGRYCTRSKTLRLQRVGAKKQQPTTITIPVREMYVMFGAHKKSCSRLLEPSPFYTSRWVGTRNSAGGYTRQP